VLELQDSTRRAMDQAKKYEETGETVKMIALYEKTLIFLEYQYGEHILGTWYRRRKNGDMIKELKIFTLRNMLTESYIQQFTTASSDSALVWAMETRAVLETRRGNSDDRSLFFEYMYTVETQLADIYEEKSQHQKALHHRQEALAAVRNEGPGYSLKLFVALKDMAALHALNHGKGIIYAEEAYNLVAVEYGPEHPTVQTAAMTLISVYLEAGRFAEGGDFARINYESLTQLNKVDKRKPTSFSLSLHSLPEMLAMAKTQVARAWLLTPPDQRIGGPEAAEEAETLAREASDIFMTNKSNHNFEDAMTTDLAMFYETLAEVMMARGNVSSEVESVLQRALSLSQDCRVGVVPRVKATTQRFACLGSLGKFYIQSSAKMSRGRARISDLEKALDAFNEMLRICTVLYGPSDNRVSDARQRIIFVQSLVCINGGV
jgi:tetratricopeptide (TPR) repeat protein